MWEVFTSQRRDLLIIARHHVLPQHQIPGSCHRRWPCYSHLHFFSAGRVDIVVQCSTSMFNIIFHSELKIVSRVPWYFCSYAHENEFHGAALSWLLASAHLASSFKLIGCCRDYATAGLSSSLQSCDEAEPCFLLDHHLRPLSSTYFELVKCRSLGLLINS